MFDESGNAAFIGLLGFNKQLVKIVAPSAGVTAAALVQLKDAMHERSSRASMSVKYLDLSDNNIGDGGVDALAEILATLPYMPNSLGLARLGVSRKNKAMVSLLSSLRKNVFTGNSLTAINLSDNKFDPEAVTALAAWLALPNCVRSLGLANTGVVLEKICGTVSYSSLSEHLLEDALSRGCVSQLQCLDLSRNNLKSCAPLLPFIKTTQSMQVRKPLLSNISRPPTTADPRPLSQPTRQREPARVGAFDHRQLFAV